MLLLEDKMLKKRKMKRARSRPYFRGEGGRWRDIADQGWQEKGNRSSFAIAGEMVEGE